MKKKIIAILALVVLAVGCLSLVACKEEEEPIPWWEERDKLEFVLEDDRSVEKIQIDKPGATNRILFNYTYVDGIEVECIPTITTLHDGVEKNASVYIQTRERYSENLDRYNAVSVVKGIGKYNVFCYVYPTRDDMLINKNKIIGILIEIIITKGE